MRIVPFTLSALVAGALVYVLNRPIGPLPFAAGEFLSPQHGFWLNAEEKGGGFNTEIFSDSLQGNATVYFDDRLVPHVFAENDHDLYFIQGYLHAKFRLFQMDLQTRAAEGRASEFAGARAIAYDREQRRLGMAFAAENALKEIEKDPLSKSVFDAYTKGVNTYINSLTTTSLPLEYRLLNVRPAAWSNFRTALLLKMMAKMLAGGTEQDFAYSNVRDIFSEEEIRVIYPQVQDSLVPIIPKGTAFAAPGIVPVAPPGVDSAYIRKRDSVRVKEIAKPDPSNGSNNWVVSGVKTQSGAPILCNDPHLELSLPSIWYEIQLHGADNNAYGVSLPGSPFIIIGFNDSVSWGVTNAQRDVKDYYEVKFKDSSKNEYWFNNRWEKATLRYETIRVKGGPDVYDTVAYTIMGPVMYDASFGNEHMPGKNLAVRWMAHEPSNEGMTFYHLNRAGNYADYTRAIAHFDCPAQNFVFASVSGDIAIWQQGKFPARWNRQGLYIMPGEDSSYFWQGYIPQEENPHILNPAQGYLQSANQRPVDSTYPYFIPGSYITARGVTIDRLLSGMSGITPEQMMLLQNNYFNSMAEDALPILLNNLMDSLLTNKEQAYVQILRGWDLRADPGSKGQTIYQNWWDSLEAAIWADELGAAVVAIPWPEEQTTLELLKRDTALRYIDNIHTPGKESLRDLVTQSLKKITPMLETAEEEGRLAWGKFKNPSIYHLIKDLGAFARKGLPVGGHSNIINAVKHSHGPSWRMIVQMSSPVEAWGIYPGGQSGNPGSPYYDNMVDDWAAGKYYRLWFMKKNEASDARVKGVMKFSKKQS